MTNFENKDTGIFLRQSWLDVLILSVPFILLFLGGCWLNNMCGYYMHLILVPLGILTNFRVFFPIKTLHIDEHGFSLFYWFKIKEDYSWNHIHKVYFYQFDKDYELCLEVYANCYSKRRKYISYNLMTLIPRRYDCYTIKCKLKYIERLSKEIEEKCKEHGTLFSYQDGRVY